jgi:hypothetical protein
LVHPHTPLTLIEHRVLGDAGCEKDTFVWRGENFPKAKINVHYSAPKEKTPTTEVMVLD